MAQVNSSRENIDLQDRDIAFLRGLFESRLMTMDHIAALHFDGKREYVKTRMRQLKLSGFIGERRRRVIDPSILFLTRKGYLQLKNRGHLSGFPLLDVNSFEVRASVSELTLQHELEVMDIKSALHTALAKSQQFELLEFGTWPILHEFRVTSPNSGKEVTVRPDAFISVHEKEPGSKGFIYDCFLEVDRSTEIQSTLVAKAGHYVEYYRTGKFATRKGGQPKNYKEFPFRVLMVMKSSERRNNTAERLLERNPPILSQVWLTTYAEVTTDPLGPIWIQPKQYLKFRLDYDEMLSPRRTLPYQRNPHKETFIEKSIEKNHLLDVPVS